ncbi:S49 family peptidase [Candidatus Kaiserbacteria bacterium]|nr:S49 family peptidase [Candidatus Kaiserbacteria bacterium]
MKSFLYNFARLIILVVAIIGTFTVCLTIWGVWYDEWSGYSASVAVSDGSCNIAVAPVMGDIVTVPYASNPEDPAAGGGANVDAVLAYLRQAENDPYIEGILVRIDSYGGMPAGSEMIANAVKNSALPSVGLIREAGTSGGYLIATGADVVIASPFSDVGSIGMTMSYVENWEQNERDGLRYVPLASAEFKDYGDPNKPLTSAEHALIERDLKIYHEQFVKEVAENRNLPIEEVAKLADGSSMPGSLALEHKLVDVLGDQETARTWFAEQLGIPPEEVVFCE